MGKVEAIYLAESAAGVMIRADCVDAAAGAGLVGDRYAAGAGTFSKWPRDHELTLIEAEAIEAISRELPLTKEVGGFRRNLVTRGVGLNDWVGREFFVGEVSCRGTRLCEPCAHLQRMMGIEGLVEVMMGRGGLRAVIISGGVVRVGDEIRLG